MYFNYNEILDYDVQRVTYKQLYGAQLRRLLN